MELHRLVSCLLGAALLLGTSSGCQSIYRERPIVVSVIDAETTRPIPNALVHLSYPLARPSNMPDESSEKTGADGIARLTTTPNGKDALRIEASANGYQADRVVASDAVIEKIETVGFFESASKRPPKVVLVLYSGNKFTIELVVQNGYKGLVKAEILRKDDGPVSVGQRDFVYPVLPYGVAQVTAPTFVLDHVQPANYHARYEDGTPLGGKMDATTVGFRWIKQEGNFEVYVVGTLPEFETQKKQMFPDDHPAPTTSSPKSGGGGRHGGGGGGGMGAGGMGGAGGGMGGMGGGGGMGGMGGGGGMGGMGGGGGGGMGMGGGGFTQ